MPNSAYTSEMTLDSIAQSNSSGVDKLVAITHLMLRGNYQFIHHWIFLIKMHKKEAIPVITALIDDYETDSKPNGPTLYLRALIYQQLNEDNLAIELLEQAIERGSDAAFVSRANMYSKGLGGPKELDKAVELYKKAIALKNSSAKACLANLYLYIQKDPQKRDEAIELLQEAIADNSTEAMFVYAEFRMHHVSQTAENAVEIVKLLEKGSSLGNTQCMLLLAQLHLTRQGLRHDFDKTNDLFDLAVAWGNDPEKVANARLNGLGEGDCKNLAKGIDLLEQAIAWGNVSAMVTRAYTHCLGQGGPKDDLKAIELLEPAIAMENTRAMYLRAMMYIKGEGGAKDIVKGIELLDQAITLNSAESMSLRALLHQAGEGGPVNFSAAVTLYEQAMAMRDITAFTKRALMHIRAQGGPEDLDRAVKLLRQANQLEMLSSLAFTFVKQKPQPDYTKAAKLYRLVAKYLPGNHGVDGLICNQAKHPGFRYHLAMHQGKVEEACAVILQANSEDISFIKFECHHFLEDEAHWHKLHEMVIQLSDMASHSSNRAPRWFRLMSHFLKISQKKNLNLPAERFEKLIEECNSALSTLSSITDFGLLPLPQGKDIAEGSLKRKHLELELDDSMMWSNGFVHSR